MISLWRNVTFLLFFDQLKFAPLNKIHYWIWILFVTVRPCVCSLSLGDDDDDACVMAVIISSVRGQLGVRGIVSSAVVPVCSVAAHHDQRKRGSPMCGWRRRALRTMGLLRSARRSSRIPPSARAALDHATRQSVSFIHSAFEAYACCQTSC